MACPREGGEECEHPAGGVHRGVADGGGMKPSQAEDRDETGVYKSATAVHAEPDREFAFAKLR